jgi:hypothetical protein
MSHPRPQCDLRRRCRRFRLRVAVKAASELRSEEIIHLDTDSVLLSFPSNPHLRRSDLLEPIPTNILAATRRLAALKAPRQIFYFRTHDA